MECKYEVKVSLQEIPEEVAQFVIKHDIPLYFVISWEEELNGNLVNLCFLDPRYDHQENTETHKDLTEQLMAIAGKMEWDFGTIPNTDANVIEKIFKQYHSQAIKIYPTLQLLLLYREDLIPRKNDIFPADLLF